MSIYLYFAPTCFEIGGKKQLIFSKKKERLTIIIDYIKCGFSNRLAGFLPFAH